MACGGMTFAIFGNEDPVIAESVFAFLRKGNRAVPDPFEQMFCAVIFNEADTADKVRLPVIASFEFLQDGHAAFMFGLKSLVTGGVDTGFIVEGFDFQPAVIREHKAVRAVIYRLRFQYCIFFKRGSGFLDLKVNVLGKWGKQIQALLKGTDSNIVFTGYIEDISGFLNNRISIVPIRIGSGMRMKILDSIVAGSPIVTTEKGCEGLPFVDNEDYMIADSPEKFADAIIELLNDPDKQRILAENIQGKLDKQFDFEAMKSLRLSFYDKLSQDE